jgi:hypothetical protein
VFLLGGLWAPVGSGITDQLIMFSLPCAADGSTSRQNISTPAW